MQLRGPCRKCNSDDHKALYGCPYTGHAGKGAQPVSDRGINDKSITRTCPEWFATRPAIGQLYDDIEDYRRGALGNVHKMPRPHLTLLRVLDAELSAEKAEIEEAIYDG